MFAGRSQTTQDAAQAATSIEPPPDAALAQRLKRIRRRWMGLAALDGAVCGAAAATAGVALLVAVCRWRALPLAAWALGAIVAAGTAVGAAARTARRRSFSWAACARLVDRVLDGQDRVLSAVWLAGSSSPLARAAVADALARTARLEPRAAVPARRPAGVRGLGFAVVALAVAWLIPGGSRAARVAPPAATVAAATPLAPGLLDAERAALARARARAAASEDPALRALTAALDRMVGGLASGRIDESAALEGLRVLDQQALAAAEAAARDARAAREAAKALSARAATQAAGEALRREASAAGDEAAQALGASAAQQPAATGAALRAAAEAVAQTAADQSDQQPGQRRLHRDQPEGAGAESGNAGGAQQDQRRKLEQLSRDLDQAGGSCASGDPRCRTQAESGGRALGGLQRGASAEPALRDLERATRQLHDRIARGDLRNAQSEAARAFAQAAAGGESAGHGEQPGPTPGKATSDSNTSDSTRSGSPSSGTPSSGSPAEGSAPGQAGSATATSEGAAAGGDGDPSGGDGTAGDQGGDQATAGGGIGHENGGAPLAGRESAPTAAGRDARVPIADGAGPSRAQVIDGAAARGFASRPYAHVYADYRSAVEDALGATGVPPGQQYLVRRYFDLIRPRAARGAKERR